MKRHNLLRSKAIVTIATLAVAIVVPAGRASAHPNDLHSARAGTAGYHDVDNAIAAGYGEFADVNGITCIENPGVGAMGVHYVNGTLVGDPTETAATPEAVVYEPERNGHLRMVAVEYIVVKSAWEGAGNAAPPSLFGEEFMLVTSPNRYGLPDFYALHAWIGKRNPSGLFSMWNPAVNCTGDRTRRHDPAAWAPQRSGQPAPQNSLRNETVSGVRSARRATLVGVVGRAAIPVVSCLRGVGTMPARGGARPRRERVSLIGLGTVRGCDCGEREERDGRRCRNDSLDHNASPFILSCRRG